MAESAFSERIVQNLLDTDFYKLTMMQAVLHNYPNAEVEWEFRCRSQEDLRPYLSAIHEQLEYLMGLVISGKQPVFLERTPSLASDFIHFLGLFRSDPRYVQTGIENDEFFLRLGGPWLHVILFEVPSLAMISEVRNHVRYPVAIVKQARERLQERFDWPRREASAEELTGFKMADFGTRRRFSYRVHEAVVSGLKEDFPGCLVGTNNVHLACKLDFKPLGTMAHEWLMTHQQLGPRLIDSQSAALDCWAREYRGLPGVALTGCITTDAFLHDFDLYLVKLSDGLRHDSGDPLLWAEKTIAHHLKLGIGPLTKTLVFSDGLDLPRVLKIYRALQGRINVSFGTGMHSTCDLSGVEPMSIVARMSVCNGHPVAKTSDTPGKAQCRGPDFIYYLKHVLRVAQGKPGALR